MEKVPVTIQVSKDIADYLQYLPSIQRAELEESLEEKARNKMEEKRAMLKKSVYEAFGADQEMIDRIEEQLKHGTMEELLDRMHLQAQANGMTEEIFNELMKDEE